MNFVVVTTIIAWLLFLNNQPQNPSVMEKLSLFEERALAETQRILASELDAELPGLSFENWFKQVAGPEAGVIWQLSECGEITDASPRDIRACVEANAILRDGRRVIVMVAAGTFKEGRIGVLAFYFGAIEQGGELSLVRRLRDLPKLLWAPGSLTKRPAIKLPESNIPKVNNAYMAVAPAWSGKEISLPMTFEEPPPPEPPPPEPPLRGEGKPWGDVINKVQPQYPAIARRLNASGPVEVQITISKEGRVIKAKAINGHPMLRGAAEEAARQWVFRPATLNGAPVETQRVLIFVFRPPQ